MIALALTSLEATDRFAAALAPHLRDGDVLELIGDVGAGKTTFTGALARALGAHEPARSPTYTVAHSYELPDEQRLAHLDCYRAGSNLLDAEAWGDVEPYFDGGIACVEWPEPIRPWISNRPTWRLRWSAPSLDARTVRIDVPEGRDAVELADSLAPVLSPRPAGTANTP